MNRPGDSGPSPELEAQLHQAARLHQSGELQKAERLYRSILQQAPRHPFALNYLGILASQTGRREDAVDLMKRAIEIDPTQASFHYNLGNVLLALDRLDEAENSFRQAVARHPGHGPALNHLGLILGRQGRIEEAIETYRRAAHTDPGFVQPYRDLAMAKTFTSYDDDVRDMEQAMARSDSPAARMHLHFALGKAFEDIRRYDQSFEHYAEGNRLFRGTFHHDSAEDERYFATIKGVFSAELFRRWENTGCQDTTPIFVVGMPRSGTTLVEQILASHPQVHGAGELGELQQAFLSDPKTAALSLTELPSRLEPDDFRRLGAIYVDLIRRYSDSADHIVNKMPQNFFSVGIIKLILPNAKVIHCQRNPVDTCLSIFTRHFSEMHKYAYDMTELGRYYRLYFDLMAHWRSVLPGFMLDVKYESLIADQETETRRLLDFCGLPWNDACLSFYSAKRPIKTASVAQVRKPIYRSSVRRWKRYEAHLGPLLEALGSELANDDPR